MGDLIYVLPALIVVILIWFTYLIVNFAATIIKTKKKDKSMVCGLNNSGKIFYGVSFVLYIVIFFGACYFIITSVLKNDINSVYLPLNILTLYSIAFNYVMQWIIYFGSRQVLIGRFIFDYRKIKRVTYPKHTKLRFAYGQRTLETNVRFIDDSLLKKSLQKTR